MAINKVDEIKIINKDKIARFDMEMFLKKMYRKLNSVNPDSLKDIYKNTGIKILHRFVYKKSELVIDIHSINYRDYSRRTISYGKNDKYKSKIINKIEKYIDKNTREVTFKYDENIDSLNKLIENDLEITTVVDNIDLIRNIVGFIDKIIISKDGKTYVLKLADKLN